MVTDRPRLSFKTSEFGRKVIVRTSKDVNERETACTPFCEIASMHREKDRCYISMRTDRESAFHAYLTSIDDQIRAFLCPLDNLRMPYDEDSCILRVKIPVRGGRIAVRAHDASSLDEIPPSSIVAGQVAAVQMVLHDVWTDADFVAPTWVAEKLLVRR